MGFLFSWLAPALALAAALCLASCGAAPASTAITCTSTTSTSTNTTATSTCTDPVTNISITISPATVSVSVVTEQQFQASLSGGTNSIVTWQVNGKTPGDDTVGRIDSSGLYHAPVKQPSPDTVTVTAVSFEDSKLSASSTVTITPAPVVSIMGTSGSTTCNNSSTATTLSTPCVLPVTSGAANTIAFTGSETGGTTNTVIWSVGPVGGLPIEGGNATLGTINANGVYSAPATPPSGQIVTVTASAGDCPDVDTCPSSAALSVMISGYSTSSLGGQFAFSISGSNGGGRFFRAGSFTADTTGGLTNLIEDVNPAPGGTGNPITANGTYTVGPDGRGTLTFADSLTPSGFSTFAFVLVNAGQLQIIGFDSSGTASGQAIAQDASTFFGAPLSALNGTYVFDFSGVQGSGALSEIGEFAADGAGNIKQAALDIDDAGALSSPPLLGTKTGCIPPKNTTPTGSPSSYSVGSNGRGTLTLNTYDLTSCSVTGSYVLTFYVVSRGAAEFVGVSTTQGTNSSPLQVSGYSMEQTSGAALNPSVLNGSYAFLLAGAGPGGPIATTGSFVADGSGHLTSGVLDENVNGAPAANLPFQASGGNAGTYTLVSNGRGTLSFATSGRAYTLVFYLGSVGTSTTAVFQETDSGIASDGIFALQSTPFSLASISGNYAISTGGISAGSPQVLTGQLAADGAGAIKSGSVVDVNTAGTLNAGQAVTGTYTAPVTSGRVALSLTPIGNYAAYIVSSTEVFLLDLQPGQLAAGTLLRQF